MLAVSYDVRQTGFDAFIYIEVLLRVTLKNEIRKSLAGLNP